MENYAPTNWMSWSALPGPNVLKAHNDNGIDAQANSRRDQSSKVKQPVACRRAWGIGVQVYVHALPPRAPRTRNDSVY
jgi:hypothetical protein